MPHEQDRRELEALEGEGFRGPTWDRLATRLAGYGFQVMVAWIQTGQVFDRVQEKTRHIRLKPPPDGRALTGEVAEELAVETVGRALRAFRIVLEQQGWSASGGASLHTFFIGQCLFRFPDVYRRWLGETRPSPWKEVEILEELAEVNGRFAQLVGADPAESVGHRLDLAEAALQLNEQLDERTFFVLRKRCEGYTQAEIAEMLRISPRVVERLIARHRRWQQQQTHEGGAA